MGSEVGGLDGSSLGSGPGDGRSMVSHHWPNRLRRHLIVSSWAFWVTTSASIIEHVRMDMAWMMQSSVVREGCSK